MKIYKQKLPYGKNRTFSADAEISVKILYYEFES